MDFQQRFKGKMTVIRKEGIESLISTGGIPVKSFCNSPFRTNTNTSFQSTTNYEDEVVNLSQTLNDNQLPGTGRNSPQLETVLQSRLNTAALEPTPPMMSIDHFNSVLTTVRHRKKAISLPQPYKKSTTQAQVEVKEPMVQQNTERRNFFRISQTLREESPSNLVSQSMMTYSSDTEPLHPRLAYKNEEWVQGYQGLQDKGQRSPSMMKDIPLKSSISEIKEQEDESYLEIRQMRSVGSNSQNSERKFSNSQGPKGRVYSSALRQRPPQQQVQQPGSPHQVQQQVYGDPSQSNVKVYEKMFKSKLQNIKDTLFKADRLMPLSTQHGRSQTPNKIIERFQQGPVLQTMGERSEGSPKLLRDSMLLSRERVSRGNTLILPKLRRVME